MARSRTAAGVPAAWICGQYFGPSPAIAPGWSIPEKSRRRFPALWPPFVMAYLRFC
ncbi:Uncharacterised protein [Mycobacteroides abscessus subsp. abscessus]|nr:Uncharacterised protein [Mycobacteroides abscessus subsp. abscessus]